MGHACYAHARMIFILRKKAKIKIKSKQNARFGRNVLTKLEPIGSCRKINIVNEIIDAINLIQVGTYKKACLIQ